MRKRCPSCGTVNCSAREQAKVEEWNKKHRIGASVEVTKDDQSKHMTITKSAAWLMGGHTAMIMLRGISGAYMLDRCKPL